MQMIIEARLVDDQSRTDPVRLAVIDRELTTSPLGLSLAEGKGLLAAAQKYFVDQQSQGIAAAHAVCEQCDRPLRIKGRHHRQIRTIFGRVTVGSPRVRCCACANLPPGASFSPLTLLVPTGVTPELEYLQVKWAAHLPYAAASKLLMEVLPIDDSISVSSMKRRVRAVGATLEHAAHDATVATPKTKAAERSAPRPSLTALAVDSAWLRHCDPPRQQGRHVNLVAGC